MNYKEILKDMEDYKIAGCIGIIIIVALVIGFIFLKLRRIMLAFIIGSSIASCIFSLSYIVFNKYKFKVDTNIIYIPLLYGAFNVINASLIRRFAKSKLTEIIIPFIIGAVQGASFSIITKDSDHWKSHLYCSSYYSALYGLVITFLNKLYLLY